MALLKIRRGEIDIGRNNEQRLINEPPALTVYVLVRAEAFKCRSGRTWRRRAEVHKDTFGGAVFPGAADTIGPYYHVDTYFISPREIHIVGTHNAFINVNRAFHCLCKPVR